MHLSREACLEKFLCQGGNLSLMAFGIDSSANSIPTNLLPDLSLHPGHDSAIEASVSGPFGMRITGHTHRLVSFGRINSRIGDLHTKSKALPSST